MAKKVELKLVIGRDGEVQVEVNGVKGPDCLEYIKLFEKIVGPEKSRELTSEYYETEDSVIRRLFGRSRRK